MAQQTINTTDSLETGRQKINANFSELYNVAQPTPGGTGGGTDLGWINVKTDYGAKGDGATADHGAIQSALDAAASAANGGVVYFPPGVYVINKYLTYGSKTAIRGAGMNRSTIRCGGGFTGGGTAPRGGYSMLQAKSGPLTDVAIEEIEFDGNESANRGVLSTYGGRIAGYLVDLRNTTRLRVNRVRTRNSWTYNIMVKDCSEFSVTQCDVKDPGTSGVYNQLDGIHILGSNRGVIAHNHIDNRNGSDADDALVAHTITGGQPCYDLAYIGNVARGGANGNGIQIAGDTQPIYNITIADNVFWGCRAGIFTNWYATSGNAPMRNLSVVGNTVRDTKELHPIWIHRAADGYWEDITIANNVVDGWGNASASDNRGIYVEGQARCRGITISGNTLRNGYSRGIELLSTSTGNITDYAISSNVVDLTAAATAPLGIIAGSSADGVIANNVVVGTGSSVGGSWGISFSGKLDFPARDNIVNANRVRNFSVGIRVRGSSTNGTDPTRTIVTSNNTGGCATGYEYGTSVVTQSANL